MKKTVFILSLAALFFASCGKDDSEKDIENLGEKIIGKWIVTDINGKPAITNHKMVYTFLSATSAYCSTSRADYTETDKMWNSHVESEVTLNGNNISLTGHISDSISFVAEIHVKSISESEMLTDSKYTLYRSGTSISTNQGEVRWTKVPKDYSQDILGLWEGHIMSDQSRFNDGEEHRWEYKADETYVYWAIEDGEWVDNVNSVAEYFVDGNLLCTRWKNRRNPTEYREWWEIASIENGVMTWTALRQDPDGTTYTASFSMTKMQ